jgi:hypothetical protein
MSDPVGIAERVALSTAIRRAIRHATTDARADAATNARANAETDADPGSDAPAIRPRGVGRCSSERRPLNRAPEEPRNEGRRR